MTTARAPRPAPAALGPALALGFAWASGLFCLAVAVLLLANRAQSRRADPLNSTVLREWMARAAQSPADAALARQAREMDLLARRAYFGSQTFARTGGGLLLGGALAWLAALKTLQVVRRRAVLPGPAADDAALAAARRRERVAIALAGAAVAAAAAWLFLATRPKLPPDLPPPPPDPAAANPAPGPADAPPAAMPAAAPAAAAAEAEMAANWPAFRGYRGLARSSAGNVPTRWDGRSGEGILWKTEVPLPGYGSPIAWGDRVLVTGADATHRAVFCFDAADGKLRWRFDVKEVPGSPAGPPEVSDDTGFAAATPATDGRRVFAVFANGDLAACDLDGKPLWSRSLGLPRNTYGYASSLLAHGELLFVQFDDAEAPRVEALRAATGETAWRTERDLNPSWASPVLAEHEGVLRLLLLASPNLVAYDPASGALLWRAGNLNAEIGTSPAYAEGLAFAVNEYAVLVAVDVATGAERWTSEEALPDVSSPLAVGPLLFTATKDGIVLCRDAATGEQLWQQEFDTGFYSSAIAVGDRVYLADLDGLVRQFRAARTYEALGECPLGEACVATPAAVGGRLYFRGRKHLFAVGAPAVVPPAVAE